MEAYGCKIVSTLCADNPEGFSSTVEKGEIRRGPFLTIREAVECARDWDKLGVSEVTTNEPLTNHTSDVASTHTTEQLAN